MLDFVKAPVGSVEVDFRGKNPPSDPPNSVSGLCNPTPTTGAHESIAGGSVPVGSGRLNRVRFYLDTPNPSA